MMELDGTPAAPEKLAGLGLYNYGHFTSMRVENFRVRGLSLHLERLVRDCRILFDATLDADRVRHLIRRAAGANTSPIIVRVTAYDPDLDLGHPGDKGEPHLLITTRSAAASTLPPLRLQSAYHVRELPAVKHVGLFGNIYHRRAAQLRGFDDVLFLDADSCISEGATWNIAFFDGRHVVWPQSDCLPGVTMHIIKDVLHQKSVHFVTAPVKISQVNRMRSAFITNAAAGLRPVRSIDDVNLSHDISIFKELQESYTKMPGEEL